MGFFQKCMTMLWRLSMLGLKRGPHITRYSMYRSLSEISLQFACKEGDVLSISHSLFLCDILGIKPKILEEANYPDSNMLALPFPEEAFDFVLSDQVLEHVAGSPQQAVNESWRVLRKEGIAVHTTCLINPIHDVPGDYWRFTPNGLKLLSNKFSKILMCEGWGNFDAWFIINKGLRFDGIPHAQWHPLHHIATKNDPLWPIVTWIVAQK
jgi:SAM-dependent methyltransferase